MKVIKKIDTTGLIMVGEIREHFIVVGLNKSKEPVLLQRESFNDPDKYRWVCVDKGLSKANSVIAHIGKLKDVVSDSLDDGYVIAAFGEKEWIDAFQWLIDNTK